MDQSDSFKPGSSQVIHGWAGPLDDSGALPRVTDRRTVAESRLFRIEEVDLCFANGARRCFERVRGTGYGGVLIVPVMSDGRVLLVREYAAGVERYELGLPKGRLESGEAVLDAANREIMEEVGYGAHHLEALGRLTLAPAYLGHATHVVLATQLYPASRPGDEPEPLKPIAWPLTALDKLLAGGEITEARSIAALFMVRERFAGRNDPA